MDAAETPDGPETAAHDGGRPAWQHRLLAGGEEPDPRFTLAHERTGLAGVRPALASVACMVALVVGLAGLGITATLLHAA